MFTRETSIADTAPSDHTIDIGAGLVASMLARLNCPVEELQKVSKEIAEEVFRSYVNVPGIPKEAIADNKQWISQLMREQKMISNLQNSEQIENIIYMLVWCDVPELLEKYILEAGALFKDYNFASIYKNRCALS